MSNLNPITPNATNAAAPLAGNAPLMAGTTTPTNTMGGTAASLLPATGGMPLGTGTGAGLTDTHHTGEKLSWHEKRAIKHQNKAIKHQEKAQHHGHGHGNDLGIQQQNHLQSGLMGATTPGLMSGATSTPGMTTATPGLMHGGSATPGLMSGATPGLMQGGSATPGLMSGAPGPITTTTVLPRTAGLNSGLGAGDAGLLGGNNKHLSKQERKALKHQNKALKHQHGHHQHGVPLAQGATTGAPLGAQRLQPGISGGAAPIAHGATNVIQHQPIVEREVVVERPVEVRREHHIQPVIHEREHRIQPVVKTEITTERRDMLAERDVMLPAVVKRPQQLNSAGMLNQTTTDQRGILPGTGTTAMGTGLGAQRGVIGKQGIQPATGLGTTAGLGTTGSALGNNATRF